MDLETCCQIVEQIIRKLKWKYIEEIPQGDDGSYYLKYPPVVIDVGENNWVRYRLYVTRKKWEDEDFDLESCYEKMVQKLFKSYTLDKCGDSIHCSDIYCDIPDDNYESFIEYLFRKIDDDHRDIKQWLRDYREVV